MPKLIDNIEGYEFSIYSSDRLSNEPPHVHVYKNGQHVKIWLGREEDNYYIDVEEDSEKFTFHNQKELSEAINLVLSNKSELLNRWYELNENEDR